MITGSVASHGREATIMLTVRGSTGRTLQVEAVVDTGFTDCLSMSREQIDQIGCQWLGRVNALVADGRGTTADVFAADVDWDGTSQRIGVVAVDADPLVGMKLMQNHRLTIDIVPFGQLRLENIDATQLR